MFDLDSQKGIMLLLASVRGSSLNNEQKNELRDLLFLYTNGGRDHSVKVAIEQKINQYGVKLPEPKPTVPSPQSYPFGVPRNSPNAFQAKTSYSAPSQQPPTQPIYQAPPPPNFAPPAQPPQYQQPPQPQYQQPVYQAPVQQFAPPQYDYSQVPPQQFYVNQQPPTQPIYQAPPPPNFAPPAQPPQYQQPPQPQYQQPVYQAPVQQFAPPQQVYQAPAAPVANPESEVYMKRIREIKAEVNEKVGNPVNLVDIDNSVGREYMAALLDAMKKINSGVSPVAAMQRLELAYTSVQEAIENHAKMPASAPVLPVEPIKNELPPVLPIEEVLSQENPSPATNRIPVTTFTAPADSLPVVEDFDQRPPHSSELAGPSGYAEPLMQTADSILPAKISSLSQTPSTSVPPQTESPADWGPASDTVQKADQNIRVSIATPLSRAETKPKSPLDLPTASSLETSSVAGDPLFTKDVDEGLNQLLLEWSIFKKSGFFGSGPSGREHPLFKKMAGLQIPLLLAGRFEGATQEVKQSVTDYMNGWRYEQGIVYEQGETFEHYLRRVIRHILDLQKRKKK